jgi:hypothetical protein
LAVVDRTWIPSRVAGPAAGVVAAIFASFADILLQLARRALYLGLGQLDEGLHRPTCIQQDRNTGTPGELGAGGVFQVIERRDFLLQRSPLFKRITAVVLRVAVVPEGAVAPGLVAGAPGLAEGLHRLAPLLCHFLASLGHEALQRAAQRALIAAPPGIFKCRKGHLKAAQVANVVPQLVFAAPHLPAVSTATTPLRLGERRVG